jgi:threonylcarbamoyladenosine tRNA methylthiotransferase MtaB
LVKQHPGAFVVVTGCYAQLKPQEIVETPGVDLVLGSEQKANIIPMILEGMTGAHTVKTADIKTFAESCSRGDRTRYFLKVQDGCNYYCTYCTIPIARGRSRNGSIASMVAQAQQVAAEGGKEIVITGVNIGDFGHSTGETFFDLVKALDQVEGIERYRISSIEPNLLTDDIIRFVATSRAFLPHFHIPLQAGSDHVLQMMHRRYSTALYRDKLEAIKSLMPDACIAADIMAGFKNLAGGEIKSYTAMMNEGRTIAEERMIAQAQAMGANAIICMRFDSSSVLEGTQEMPAYGTAVRYV